MNKILPIAFYLPQFHPIPENDLWWGTGFTEWTNVKKAKPLFPGHYQPHIPGELGYYDLRDPEMRQKQVDLAKKYGVYGFCYYHYWFNGKRSLNQPIDEVLSSGTPDFPFCLCWANENWTRRWDGREQDVLMKQYYSQKDDAEHIKWLCKVFQDKRYIRVQGKPIFLVYRTSLLPNPKKTIEVWKKEARKAGVGDIYLCKVQSCFPDEQGDPQDVGFDAAVGFQPNFFYGESVLKNKIKCFWAERQHCKKINGNKVYNYDWLEGIESKRVERSNKEGFIYYPCVTPGWDNSSRRKKGAIIFRDSSPEQYEKWLRDVVTKQNFQNGEKRIVFINAWNEWGEGNHLEPDLKWGRAYLEATKKAIGSVGGQS